MTAQPDIAGAAAARTRGSLVALFSTAAGRRFVFDLAQCGSSSMTGVTRARRGGVRLSFGGAHLRANFVSGKPTQLSSGLVQSLCIASTSGRHRQDHAAGRPTAANLLD